MLAVEPRERFAANLKRQRKKTGLSQEALAAECGLHRTEVSLLETGRRDPQLQTIVRLARGLGVGVGELVRGIR